MQHWLMAEKRDYRELAGRLAEAGPLSGLASIVLLIEFSHFLLEQGTIAAGQIDGVDVVSHGPLHQEVEHIPPALTA